MMKKNSNLHIVLETELLDKLKQEAEEKDLLLSELCRHKLRQNDQLNRIEFMIEQILGKKKV